MSRLRKFIFFITYLLSDPSSFLNKFRGLPLYLRDVYRWKKKQTGESFSFSWKNVIPFLDDRFKSAAEWQSDYFFQDIWAARQLCSRQISFHVDVGSSFCGFVAHILGAGINTVYVDVRRIHCDLSGLNIVNGSITQLPFSDGSISSLSCLHVLEHIGLGRYGDPVDPSGYRYAAQELARILAPGGSLLIGTPIGRERLCFNANLVFAPTTIVKLFAGLVLKEFSYIPAARNGIIPMIEYSRFVPEAGGNSCGLFVFEKAAA